MQDINLNALWCRIIIEELLSTGVSHAILAPGGRSAIMALQLHDYFPNNTIVHGDERSAAFIALGIAKASAKPVIVCTTSGSAVANLLPALTEAYADDIPLILLTCDRPQSQRRAGAPQSTEQVAICRPLVHASIDLTDPQNDEASLRMLRSQINLIAQQFCAMPMKGPIQINIPLLSKNCTTEIDPNWQPPAYASEVIHRNIKPISPNTNDILPAGLNLRPGLKGIIVVGNDCPLTALQITTLATLTQFPVIADASSNLRRPAIPHLIHLADALVLGTLGFKPAELIIRVGAAPMAHTLHSYLAKQKCPILRIDRHAIENDFLHSQFTLLQNPSDRVLQTLGEALAPGDAEWLSLWLDTQQSAVEKINALLTTLPWSDVQAAATVCNTDTVAWLHLANSMSARLGNLLCQPRSESQTIFANRGVNGIDGTLGTFIGELYATQQRGLLLIGDQTFLHDLPALVNLQNLHLNGCICLLNNHGNALFDLLDAARLPSYEKVIRNAPVVNFAALAEGFGLAYQRCDSTIALHDALQTQAQQTGVSLIEMVIPDHSTATTFSELYTVIANAKPA